jgi:hypothetical protein
MNILLLASHAVAEYDDVRMFTDLGYDIFAPGGYEVPSRSGEGIRPALPDAPHHPELVARLNEVRAERGAPGPAIDWGKAALHDDIIDWADVIICHHFPDRWIAGQWERIRHKRVVWRTCGQSDPRLEEYMRSFAEQGMQIVRYSPRERIAFERRWTFAGEDALIRFGKYPADYGPYIGDWETIGNVTQDIVARGDSVGLGVWLRITDGLPTKPAGKGSEALRNGMGALSYPDMLAYLRHIRTYFYTGTKPAPYTLGLIEAMLSGVPVVAYGLVAEGLDDEWVGLLSEAPAIVNPGLGAHRETLKVYLASQEYAATQGQVGREKAIRMFGIERIGTQWREFLS